MPKKEASRFEEIQLPSFSSERYYLLSQVKTECLQNNIKPSLQYKLCLLHDRLLPYSLSLKKKIQVNEADLVFSTISKEEKSVDGCFIQESHNGLKNKQNIRIVVFYFLFQTKDFSDNDIDEFILEIQTLCNYPGIF